MFELFDHQKTGIQFAKSRNNLIIGDEMGLGKTAQAIRTCQELNFKKNLVICKSSAKRKWLDEIQLWAPGINAIKLNGSTKERDIQLMKALADETIYYIVTNFDHIRATSKLYNLEVDGLIIDEAHKIKNRKTQITKAIKTFCRLPKKIMMLTGSPIQNRPQEIWQLLNILYPQDFRSYWRFVERYCYVVDGFFGKEITGVRNEDELHHILESIMIRRLKKDCLDLPEKLYEPEYIEMSSHQKEMYSDMADNAIALINETRILTAQVVIAQIIRLQQIAISSALVGESVNPQSAKFDWLLNFVEEYPEEKIVVFSTFLKAINLFANILDSKSINYVKYTGQENENQRDENQRLFRHCKTINIFLATIATGGESIDLPESQICIFINKHWNPEVNKQAEDRLHRIGQKKNVTVISLIAEHSVDEMIEVALKGKIDLIQRILKDKERGNAQRN